MLKARDVVECENPSGVGEGVWKSMAGGEGVAEGDDGREGMRKSMVGGEGWKREVMVEGSPPRMQPW